MAKLVFAGVVLVVGVVLWRFLLGMSRKALSQKHVDEDASRWYKIGARASLGLGLGVFLLVMMVSIFVVVPPRRTGVQVLFGNTQERPLKEGFHVVNPMMSVVEMPTEIRKHVAKYDAASKDMQAVHVEMVINYRLIPDKTPEIYRTIGGDIESVEATIIDPAAKEVLKAHTALHVASEILHLRAKIKTDVQENLTAWLMKYGIEVNETSLANISFDEGYTKAIEAKQIQEQRAEQKRYELLQAQRDAEIMTAQAKGKGDAAREEAKGFADALRTRGEAEAAYNEKVSSSLTLILIQQQYLQKWDGKLPVYSLGGNTSMLMPLPMPNDGKK